MAGSASAWAASSDPARRPRLESGRARAIDSSPIREARLDSRAAPRALLACLVLVGCALLRPDRAPPLRLAFPSGRAHPAPEVESSRLLVAHGGYLDWCAGSNQIAFARQHSPALSEIHVSGADGAGERCLTCDQPDLPQPPQGRERTNIGAGYRSAPAWHPSCEFLVFQLGSPEFGGGAFERPPFGIHNDLWLIRADGSRAERLIALGRFEGVMSAFFSAEGERLVWSQREPAQRPDAELVSGRASKREEPFQGWTIVTAELRVPAEGPAQLENRRELFRGESGVKRPSALVGQTLWFAHTRGFQRFVDEIWRFDLADGSRENLSRSPRTWEEQALPSPWGSLLGYRSSLPYGWRMGPHRPNTMRLELWVQDAEGQRTQLTSKNRTGDNSLRVLVQDFAWGPTGREIAIYTANFGRDREPRHEIEILRLNHAF